MKDATRFPAPVLLVDDDPMMTRFLGLILADEGVGTVMASEAEEAWDIFRENPSAIRAVLTDVVMPGEFDGLELAKRIRELSPDTPVVLVTGYADDYQLRSGPFPVLSKPFGRAALVAALAQASP